jgi:hypothetical protein
MIVHLGLLIFYYDIDIMFFLTVELKEKKKKKKYKDACPKTYIYVCIHELNVYVFEKFLIRSLR